MRTLAIGDIHGCLTSLETLADYASFKNDDVIVTLGDYVDRGPDSKGVIDWLLALRERRQLVHLRGNHEIMMLDALEHPSDLAGWLHVGGEATLASYGKSFADVPQEHWDFIRTALPYFEMETHFFVHANAKPKVSLEEQSEDTLYWESFGKPRPHQSGKVMVCGHTSQKSGHPRDRGHAVCIDTFAYGGGWLTCLDAGSGTYWQTNERGERRSGEL